MFDRPTVLLHASTGGLRADGKDWSPTVKPIYVPMLGTDFTLGHGSGHSPPHVMYFPRVVNHLWHADFITLFSFTTDLSIEKQTFPNRLPQLHQYQYLFRYPSISILVQKQSSLWLYFGSITADSTEQIPHYFLRYVSATNKLKLQLNIMFYDEIFETRSV